MYVRVIVHEKKNSLFHFLSKNVLILITVEFFFSRPRPLLHSLLTKPLIPCISKSLQLNSLKLQNNWRQTGDFYEITTLSKSMEITEQLWKTFFFFYILITPLVSEH